MLEVRTATCGPGIDQSQHAKSFSHIINKFIKLIRGTIEIFLIIVSNSTMLIAIDKTVVLQLTC